MKPTIRYAAAALAATGSLIAAGCAPQVGGPPTICQAVAVDKSTVLISPAACQPHIQWVSSAVRTNLVPPTPGHPLPPERAVVVAVTEADGVHAYVYPAWTGIGWAVRSTSVRVIAPPWDVTP